jgi:hypothetical protein
MKHHFCLTAAAASLLLPAASQGQDLLKPAPAAVKLDWQVNCHGLSAVPLTADAMQTLPLKLVATLSCEQGLALVSDAEGYTINVRTADGKVGYIASMYLRKAPPAKPAPRIEPVSASMNNGVARWRPGAKGCDQFTKDGLVAESLSANGVTVQVSLQDTGTKLRAHVALGNFSNLHVYIDPVGITLQSKGEHGRSLSSHDGPQVAKDTNAGGNANPSEAHVEFKESDFAPVFASVNTVEKQPVGDLTRPQAKPTINNLTDPVGADALKKGSIKPDGKTWGAVYFERDANPGSYVMRIPVDNQIYEFPLTIDPPATNDATPAENPAPKK